MSDPVTNYNYIEDAKVRVSEILKRFSTFYSGYRAIVVDLNEY